MFKSFFAFLVFMGLTLLFLKTGTFSLPLQWTPTFSVFLLSETFVSLVAIGSHGRFSIATLNVDGIRDDDERARIFEYLRSLKYDFYLLQETHVQTEDIEAWSAESGGGGGCLWNPGGNRSRGVGLVCNVSLDFEDLEVKRDFHGRLINVKLSLHDWQFQIMCIYAPNDPRDRSEFFSDLWRHTFPRIPLCLRGDFNCIESLELDRAGGEYQLETRGL